ncbi:MAG: FAD-binding protein [Mycobacteriaceae bacterium]|nr:FAD-binding protein [Mycobacteriaceae bacterium]
MPHTWRNWGHTVTAHPRQVISPTSIEDVVHVVRRARADGAAVKAVGAGHSFSAIAAADDIQLDLSRMRGLVEVDVDRSRATLRAGTWLHEIPELLEPHGLAMANLGDIDRQSLAGAISTGTHGTGIRYGGMATQVVGATLVDGRGEVRTVTEFDPDLQAVAVGLGALGILVDITLQCVPAFALHSVEQPKPIDAAIDEFTADIAERDHYEFFWFPNTDVAYTKTNHRLPADTPPVNTGRLRRWVDDELIGNQTLRALCAVTSAAPAVAPAIARGAVRLLGSQTFTDSSARVFARPRTVRFREMEYAIPLDCAQEAVRRVRDMVERKGYRFIFPMEVRAAAADDLMLSSASGRASAYVAVHRYIRDHEDGYFDAVEQIMLDYAGRPHWGKMHTRDAAYLRTVYPRFDEFLAVRARFDPDAVFRNPHLTTVLG